MSSPDPTLEQHLESELALEEGFSFFLYDDATGKRFMKGDTLVGNLTAGTGCNMMVAFDAEELDYIERHRIAKIEMGLQAYSWYSQQDPVRQTALADLTFNLGITGLLRWERFLKYMDLKDYASAMGEVKSNGLWVSQVHQARAGRIEAMILTGEWPTDVKVQSA